MKPTGILSRQVEIDTAKYAERCANDPRIKDYKRRQQVWRDKEEKRAAAIQVEIDRLYAEKRELNEEIYRLHGKINSAKQSIHNKQHGIVARKNKKEYRSGPCGQLQRKIDARKMVIRDQMMREAWSKTKHKFQKEWGIQEKAEEVPLPEVAPVLETPLTP